MSIHPPNPHGCAECEALERIDHLDLARLAEVEHRTGYSVLRPRRRQTRRRWIAVPIEPETSVGASA
jgi:hypothetical protein